MEGFPKQPIPQEKQAEENFLPEEKIKNISSLLAVSSTEKDRDRKLRQFAQQNNMAPEQLLREVNLYKVSNIREREKGEIRHFHRTSMDNLVNIIKIGRLLSKAKLKEINPDIQLPGGSASDNVMMTRDRFDAEGNLVRPGFEENEVVGASGKGALLVFKDSIMQDDTYDTTRLYPTIADLPLQEYCEVVLVDSEEDMEKVANLLIENSLTIPVVLKSSWER